jgi:hypothetical protein
MVARHAQGEGSDARGSSGRTLATCEFFEEVHGRTRMRAVKERVSYEGDQVWRGGSFDRGESERERWEGQIAHDGFY